MLNRKARYSPIYIDTILKYSAMKTAKSGSNFNSEISSLALAAPRVIGVTSLLILTLLVSESNV